MTAPTLGELARQTRLVDGKRLDEVLRVQRQYYLEGDFRRLGEILVDHDLASRPAVRALLARQGVTIAECELCQTRYNALLFRGPGTCLCLRCGRRLMPSDERAPLTVEDAISGGGPQADRMLQEHRQRNPRLGRYEVLGEVGRGGMGVIYKAWDADLHRHVALKFLRPSHDLASQEDKERFRREARAVARLRHEHIVQAHAIEEQSGLVFMAMDFVPGVSLELLGRRGALTPEQLLTVGSKIARALHYAHEHGIVHRDVKPGNIVIDRQGEPFLVDFGIAKNRSESTSLTTEGEILGSLAYMAPEYITKGNAALDRRCDVYGLGVALYEALSGELPYGEDEDERLVMRILKEPPRPLGQVKAGLPPGVEAVVMRAVAKEREARHPSAAALADDLEGVLRGGLAGLEESQRRRGEAPQAEPPLARGSRSGRLDASSSRKNPTLAGSGARREPALGRIDVFEQAAVEDEPAPAPAAPHDDDDPEAPRARPGLLVPALAGVALALALVAAVGLSLWRRAEARLDETQAQLRELAARAAEAELAGGEALERAGDLAGAEERYTRAVRLAPDDPAPLEARARVRERRGDTRGALDDRVEADVRRARRPRD
ncbi:MAG: serine/threonine protein kinase [Planctomycetes bacterium]|nr:serine/threonine protein kinase [Planctomycetota bacterium]